MFGSILDKIMLFCRYFIEDTLTFTLCCTKAIQQYEN